MKRIGNFLFILTTVFIFSSLAVAKIDFDATIDRNEVTQDDNVTLKLTLTTDGNINDEGEPRLPNIDGFQLEGKWSQSESSSVFDNGQFKFQRKFVYNYTLSPQKKGTLTIGPCDIRVNGQTLHTQPIKVTVLASNGQGRSNVAKNKNQNEDEAGGQNSPFGDDDENDLFSQLLRRRGFGQGQKGGPSVAPMPQQQDVDSKDLFFIGVEVSKKKAFVGEEIIATWYLYTRGNLQGFDALKYPELKGFWKEDLEMATRLNFHQEIVNGIPYSKALLVSYALFPIGQGAKNIDAYQAKGTVLKMDSPMAMFGLGQPVNLTKSSREIPIEVIPLPTAGRPASFSGAVGNFHVTGSLSATQVKANQPVSLKIRFTGEGNVKAIDLPLIDLPKNLDLYDTKKEAVFKKNGEGYKEFELLIVPRAEGDIVIPPIAVSFFDPKAQKYVETKTPAFPLKVLKGDASNNNIAPVTKLEEPTKAAASATPDIKYLKTSTLFALPAEEEKILWIIAFLTLYSAFGIQIWRIFRGQTGDATSEIKKRVKKKLVAARSLLKKQEYRGVGVECSNAVIGTLGEIVGGGSSTPTEILLPRLPDGSQKLQERIQKFLNRCEIISFAPKELMGQIGSESEVKKLIGDAEKIIGQLLEVSKKAPVSVGHQSVS